MKQPLHPPLYPPGSIRMLIESDLITPPTRDALRERLTTPAVVMPRFFSDGAFETACAMCDRLIPQPERPRPIDLPGTLDTRLADLQPKGGGGDGWRFGVMPPDGLMHAMGIDGVDQTATAIFGRAFIDISDADQDAVLSAVQAGTAAGPIWRAMDPQLYFEELLTLVTDIYYSHPLASEEIGYAGMADAHGWQAIGLNEREAHEPVSGAALKTAA